MYRLVPVVILIACSVVPGYGGREFTARPSERVAENELLVRLKRGAAPDAIFSRNAPGAAIKRLHASTNLYRLRLPPGLQKVIARRLAADNLTDYVEPNRIRQITLAAPTDSAYASNQYALGAIKALQAWSIVPNRYLTSSTANTSRLKVAVIDTGADCTHPDFINLGGFSTNSALGGQLLWSLSEALVPTTVASPTCAWMDDHGHGTHVAGILAAATNNAQGVASLGYPLQAVVFRAIGADGLGTDADIATAIIAAADAGASVISLSFGAVGYSQTIQTAMNYAWQRNAVVIAAAGNHSANEEFFPAAGIHVLGVSATDNTNQRAALSNFGPIVGIAAPGDGIYGLAPTYGGTTLGFQSYATSSGTSMAAPQVSALAGLIGLTTPGIAAEAVVRRIQQTAASSVANGGWEQNLGYGLIDAQAALMGTLRTATVGSIRGQVVDSNEIAVPSAIVTVGGTTITTNETGIFRVPNLNAGTYQVSASGGGFPNQTITAVVVPGADTTVTVRLGVQLGTFTGRVLNGGSGVPGAVVQAIAGGLVHASATTGPDGAYSLSVLPGTYDLKVSSVSGVPAVITGRSVAAGATATIDLTTTRLGTIAGIVTTNTGTPVPNAQLTFTAPNLVFGATSNASGQYSSIGLSSGTYTVTATAPGQPNRVITGVVVSPNTTTTLNLSLGNSPPTTVSAAPNSGTGLNATLALTYSDADGGNDISYAYVLISDVLDSRNACYVYYNRAANAVYLFTDTAETLLGPITPGTAGTIQNSQCSLAATGSSVSGSGNNLTLTLALTFNASFTGTKNVYINAQDAAGAMADWTSRGTWTPVTNVNQPPATVSVSPNAGTGLNATLALLYSDPNGFTNLSYTFVLIGGALDVRNACYAFHHRPSNALFLVTDDGQSVLGPITPGTAGTIQNSQCSVAGTGSSVSGSGNNLTLTLALTFKAGFSGTKNIYMNAQDTAGLFADWTSRGTWTPGANVNQPPTTVSVSPNTGTGPNATLALTFSDPDGFANLSYTYTLIHNALDSSNACYILYHRASNAAYLLTDNGQSVIGPITPGTAGTIQNTQCSVAGTGSSVSASGNNLTLTLALTFKAGFTGTKNIYMNAQDVSGTLADWSNRGTWTPATSVNRPPTTVSVSPTTGTGPNATLALTYSDPDGFANLAYTFVLVSSALDSRNACYLFYHRPSNALFLVTDDAQTTVGPIALGTAGTMENTQCRVAGTGSSASGSGNNLTLTLALTFKAGFTGTKNVHMNAQDSAGELAGWTSRGTWTPASGQSIAGGPSGAGANSSGTAALTYSIRTSPAVGHSKSPRHSIPGMLSLPVLSGPDSLHLIRVGKKQTPRRP